MIESLQNEFERESNTTRKHLERFPEANAQWKPHEKSYSAMELACHIVESIGWTHLVFTQDEFDFDPATYKQFSVASTEELLKGLDERIEQGKRALAESNEEALSRPWRMTVRGKEFFERPRGDVFRDFVISHVIHHRGQFSVYLRLLDIPVPGSYGPSADES